MTALKAGLQNPDFFGADSGHGEKKLMLGYALRDFDCIWSATETWLQFV